MSPSFLRWSIAVATFGLLAWRQVEGNYRLPPEPLSLQLILRDGAPGTRFPLIATGVAGAGDLLYVEHAGAGRVAFGYDSWAVGGPISPPVDFTANSARPLLVELPSLAAPARVSRQAQGPLRLVYDGREVLRAEVHYYGRQPDGIYFATNPLGGTVARRPFDGAILTTAGQPLTGRPAALLSRTTRLRHWVSSQPWSVAATLALAAAAGWLLPPLLRRTGRFLRAPRADPEFAGHPRAPHGTFLVVAALCTCAFAATITGFTFRLFESESFGQFYDHQLAALLAGRLDVPEVALGAEAFVFAGKNYGYFGPTPALLRLPCALAGVGFGRLSRLYMVLYYLGSLAAAYALLILAARRLSGRPTWPARGAVVLLLGSTGLGSTLFFLGSRAYVYHEAILCGVLCALWSAYASLRWLAEPDRHRWWLLALAGGVLSVHARPPTGLFALGVLGLVSATRLLAAWRGGPARTRHDRVVAWRLPLAVGAMSVAGVFSFNALSYLKFRSFAGAPLRYHVQYDAERLAVTEGRNFHPSNLAFGLASYGWSPGLLLRPTFPYVYLQGRDPLDFPGSRIDLAESAAGLPYAMPALVLLSGLAAASALWRWPASRLPVGILFGGVVPMALALLLAIAVSHRYTGDFVPFLVATSAFGAAALDAQARALRRNLLVLASVLSLAGALVTAAITLHYQGAVVWGVPPETQARYLSLRRHVDHFLGFPSP